MSNTIIAAGAVVWRKVNNQVEIALVHRPRYDDWSLPKGKQDSGEALIACAYRETLEETNLKVSFGPFIGDIEYFVADGLKQVYYWAARLADDSPEFHPNDEVDLLEWHSINDAVEKVTRDSDREIIEKFNDVPFDSYPLIMLRHAKALAREEWQSEDEDRPLEQLGQQDEAILLLKSIITVRAGSKPTLTRLAFFKAGLEPALPKYGQKLVLQLECKHDQLPRARIKYGIVVHHVSRSVHFLFDVHKPPQTVFLFHQQLLIHFKQAVSLGKQVAQIPYILFAQGFTCLDVFGKGSAQVEGGVRCNSVFNRAVLGVKIDGEGFARQVFTVFGQMDGFEAVPRIFTGFKNHASVEQRQNTFDLVNFGVARVGMQFDQTAPSVLPFLVEVHQQVQPAVQHAAFVDIEIDMDIQSLSIKVFMGAAPKQGCVGNQVGYASDG